MLFNEIFEKDYVAKDFDTPIGKITLDKGRNIYTILRSKYYDLAFDSMKTFSDLYDSYSGCADILEKAPRDFQISIANVIDEIKNDIISIGKYDWDYDTIYEYANENGYLNPFYEPFDTISDRILSIYQDVEMQKQYREDRKNNRARWTGGTFGGNAINAYSHQMDLAARNMAEGAVHSIFNAAGNAISKAAANSELNSLFKSEEVKSSLIEGVLDTAFGMHLALVDLLNNAVDWNLPNNNDIQKAQRLLNNLKSGAIAKDKVVEICQEIMNLNPYDFDIYEYLFGVYGDKDGKLQNFADYFRISLVMTKDDLALKYIQENQGNNENEAIQAKEKLILYCKEINLPVSDDLKCIQYINNLISKYDLEYRTVDDVVCETREGADHARVELPKIQEFVNNISAPTKDSLLDYEENLLKEIEKFKDEFTSEIKDKYLNQLEKYLTDFNKYFCSTRIFGTVDRKKAGQDKALEFVKTLNFSNLEEYEIDCKKFEESLPKFGLTNDEATEAFQYLEKQKERIASGKGRTKDTGLTKNDIKIPIILLVAAILLRIIYMFTGIGLLGYISVFSFIAMIVAIVRIIKKHSKFKNSKKENIDSNINE